MVNHHDRHHQASSPVAWTWSGARDGCCPRPPRCPLTDAAAAARAGRVARHQRHCLFIPGTEGPEEGPAPDPPQVRAASGAPHQERLGGSLQSRPAAAPGRPLAPPPRRPPAPSGFCRKHALSVPYKSVTLRVRAFLAPRRRQHAHPPQLEVRSSNNGDPQTAAELGPRRRPRHRPRADSFPESELSRAPWSSPSRPPRWNLRSVNVGGSRVTSRFSDQRSPQKVV